MRTGYLRLVTLAVASMFVLAACSDDKKKDNDASDSEVSDQSGDTAPDTAPDTSPDVRPDISDVSDISDTGPDATDMDMPEVEEMTDLDMASLCGNNMVDPGETCDPPGSCPNMCPPSMDACLVSTLMGDPMMCTSECTDVPLGCEMVGDGCCPAMCAGMDADCGPDTMPRLIVADSTGIKIFDQADGLTADVNADATLATGDTLGLALHDDHLIAVTTNMTTPMFRYPDAGVLVDAATTTHAVPVAAFAGNRPSTIYDMKVDANDVLWLVTGNIRSFAAVQALGATTTSSVQFTHMWGPQIYAGVMDTQDGKLLGGQVSGAGVLAWGNIASATGEGNEPDFTLQAGGTISSMLIDGGDLYVGSYGAPNVAIWRDIPMIGMTTAPSATMAAMSNISDVSHISVRDDVLVVTVNDSPSGFKVNIYLNASTITGDVTPDYEITHANMSLPTQSWLDANDNLYVMDTDGILIFRDATTMPTYVTEIAMDLTGPADFLVMECSPLHPCGTGLACNSAGQCDPVP